MHITPIQVLITLLTKSHDPPSRVEFRISKSWLAVLVFVGSRFPAPVVQGLVRGSVVAAVRMNQC